MEEDTVSLPHQQSFSSLKTDSDYIYQVHTPCFHAPLFHSQCLPNHPSPKSINPGSSSHATLLNQQQYHHHPHHHHHHRQQFNPRARLNARTSAPDLRMTSSSSSVEPSNAETASVSNLLLSPSTASKFVFKPRGNDSKANLFSIERSDSSISKRESASASPKLESSLQSILDNEPREKKSPTAGLSEYLRQMRNGKDGDDDNEVEVKMMPQKSSEPNEDYDDGASSSSRSEAL